MHSFTRSFAFAWGNQKVCIGVVIAETELAVALNFISSIMDAVELPKEAVHFVFLTFLQSSNLNNSVFDSSQLDNVAHRQRITNATKFVTLHDNIRVSVDWASLLC